MKKANLGVGKDMDKIIFKLYDLVTVTRLLNEDELNNLNNKFFIYSDYKINNNIIKYFVGYKSIICQLCEGQYVILDLLEKIKNNCPYLGLKIPFPINIIKPWG